MQAKEPYDQLCDIADMPHSRWGREIWQSLVSQKEAEMLLTLPATLDGFCKANALGRKEAQEVLESLDLRGALIPRQRSNGEVEYTPLVNPVQFGDAIGFPLLVSAYEPTAQQEKIPYLYNNWRETEASLRWKKNDLAMRELIWSGTKKLDSCRNRVIPLPGTVEKGTDLLPIEDLEAIIKSAERIVINECICNWTRHQQGKAEGTNEVCFHFSPFETEYMLERGLGKELSVDEALERTKTMKEQGLVPLANGGSPTCNQVCMCDTRGCLALRPMSRYGYVLCFPSRFLAVCNRKKCTQCGSCVQWCPFGCITIEKDKDAYDAGKRVSKVVVDHEACQGCGVCAAKCPESALVLRAIRPADYIHEGPSICALDEVSK